MEESVNTALMGSYLKIGVATVVGACLALGIYYLVSQGSAQSQKPAPSLCVCPNCGFAVPRPAGIDCEDVNCPNCGTGMQRAAILAAGTGNQGAVPVAPMTQNRRETLAEQGIATPGPMTQNQIEPLAEQGRPVARVTALPPPNPMVTQRFSTRLDNQVDVLGQGGRLDNLGDGRQMQAQMAATAVPGTIDKPGVCICPYCGSRLTRLPGAFCSQIRCPNCGTTMTNAIFVGQGQKAQPQPEARLAATQGGGAGGGAGTGGGAFCPQGGGVGTGGGAFCPQGGGAGAGTGGPGPPCQQQGAAPATGAPPNPSMAPAATPAPTSANQTTMLGPTYTNTVQGIIDRNCARCHGGPLRNLGTYQNVKAYADSGLLQMMVQPGGPMSRFVSAYEADQIVAWIKTGAPQ